MSETIIISFKDPGIQLEDYKGQVSEIFFESSSRKDFKDQKDKDAFEWKYLGFYLCHYPEYAWLALKEGKALGYVLGMPFSQDPSLYQIQPHLKVFQEYFQKYPGHLHINCLAASRGLGIGSQLVNAFEKQLQMTGIRGLHIMTGPDSRNRAFYRRLGFDFEVELEFEGAPILFMGKSL